MIAMIRYQHTIAIAAALMAIVVASIAYAQENTASRSSLDQADLVAELQNLHAKVAALEAALETQHQSLYGAPTSTDSSTASMQQIGGMGVGATQGKAATQAMPRDSDSSLSGMGMGMMDEGMGGMGMMSMMKGKKGMMGMGMMGMNPAMASDSMAGMDMPSALPGFPGASHVYHIGQTGFFLDHPEHITLSDEQQKKLNSIKESSLLATSTAQREIAEAEQELWKLTAAAEPDIKKIEAKAKEIAQLQVATRIAFIRSVGEAASVLTKEQRQALIGEGKK